MSNAALMPTASIQDKLAQLPLCNGLTDQQVSVIAAIAEQTTLDKGATLFVEGDQGDGLYLVVVGSLEILKKDRNGQNQAIANIGGGSVLGEMSLIHGSGTRSATAVATTDAQLIKVPSEAFAYLLQHDNVTAYKMVHNLAQVMSRRLLLMDEKLVDLMDKGRKKEELSDFHKILSKWSF
jgi:CRP/FNR family transcriptional regulator, cyclic AMP receptor protein